MPAAYANVTVMRPARRNARELKAGADQTRARELALKRAIDRAAHLLDLLEQRAATYAADIARLQKRKAAALKRAEAIEDRILREMSRAGLTQAAGVRVTLTARPCPAALAIDDEAAIPEQYVAQKLVTTVDKLAVKAALARGEDVPGVRLTQRVSLLRR